MGRQLLYGDSGDMAGSWGVISSPRFESSDLTGLLLSWYRPGDAVPSSLGASTTTVADSSSSAPMAAVTASSSSISLGRPSPFKTAGGTSEGGGDDEAAVGKGEAAGGDGDRSGRAKEFGCSIATSFGVDDCCCVVVATVAAVVMSVLESSWMLAGSWEGSC